MTSQDPQPFLSATKTARELMALLGEKKGTVVEMQLRRIVVHSGREFAMEMYRRTLEVEAAGGLTFEAKTGETRRRTIGGVFYWLVKEALGPEVSAKLIPSAHDIDRRRRAAKAAARAEREAAEAQTLSLVPGVGDGVAVAVVNPEALKLLAAKKPAAKVVAPKGAPPVSKSAPKTPPVRAPQRAPIPGKKREPLKMPEVFHTVRTK